MKYNKTLKFNKINPKITIYLLIISIYLITGLSSNRYHKNYPTLILYPNNEKEVKQVKQYVVIRDPKMYNFIKLTDRSCSSAFVNYVNEDIQTLDNYTQKLVPLIIFLKNLFNRARPHQIDPNINKYPSISASNPAFPSGHSVQAQYLAKILSKKYPEKKQQLYNIADKCGKARIYAGLHYPSDHEFAKFIVDILP